MNKRRNTWCFSQVKASALTLLAGWQEGHITHKNPLPLIPKSMVLFRNIQRTKAESKAANPGLTGKPLHSSNNHTTCSPISLLCADEELWAICVWSTVRHRQCSCNAVAHNTIKNYHVWTSSSVRPTVTLNRIHLVLRCITIDDILSWYVTSHSGQLSLLSSVVWTRGSGTAHWALSTLLYMV